MQTGLSGVYLLEKGTKVHSEKAHYIFLNVDQVCDHGVLLSVVKMS